jgi:hypothetical protein
MNVMNALDPLCFEERDIASPFDRMFLSRPSDRKA